MNIVITNFVDYLDSTIESTKKGTPNYINEMPPSSPPITSWTYTNMYGGSETYAHGENDGAKLSIAKKLVSQENRSARVRETLLQFEDHLDDLFEYVKDNELSLQEKQYLLISLDAYFKAIPETVYDMFSYKTYTYTVTHYNPDDDMDYIGWPVKYYVKCPTGNAGVNLELNTLKSLALEKLISFNLKQAERQLPAASQSLTFINEKHRSIIEELEESIPTVMQETLFDCLTEIMLTDSHKEFKEYKGLARLNADSLFMDSLKSNSNIWLKSVESPNRLRDTVAFKIAVTSQSSSVFTLFSGTNTKILNQMIYSEVARRKSIPEKMPSAPPAEVHGSLVFGGLKYNV